MGSPDAARFLKLGTDPRDVYPVLARKYSPDQQCVPAGNPDGEQWTDGGGTSATRVEDALIREILAKASNLRFAGSPVDYRECVKLCYPLLERFSAPGSDKNYWDFQKCLNACLKRGL